MAMKAKLMVEDGIELKQCLQCGEWLPADAEFFCRRTDGSIHSPCKVCFGERRFARNLSRLCCVPGCTNPRNGRWNSRCKEHRRRKGKK